MKCVCGHYQTMHETKSWDASCLGCDCSEYVEE